MLLNIFIMENVILFSGFLSEYKVKIFFYIIDVFTVTFVILSLILMINRFGSIYTSVCFTIMYIIQHWKTGISI